MTARYRKLRLTAAALCFGTAALAAVPAEAGSVYLNGIGLGGGAATINLESFQEKKYKETVAQQYDFSCGSAASRDTLDLQLQHSGQRVGSISRNVRQRR